MKHKFAKWRIGWDFEGEERKSEEVLSRKLLILGKFLAHSFLALFSISGTIVHTPAIKDSAILQTALTEATNLMTKENKRAWNKLIAANSVKVTLMQEKGPSSEMSRNMKMDIEKSERWPANLKTTLASNLRGSTFIEFPNFRVDKVSADEVNRSNVELDLPVKTEIEVEEAAPVHVEESAEEDSNEEDDEDDNDDDQEEGNNHQEANDERDDGGDESDEEMDDDDGSSLGEGDPADPSMGMKIENLDDELALNDKGPEPTERPELKDNTDASNDGADS